ncbi:vegetative catalase-like [Bicyclus anynana]|uniref:Vegetative catalase-like n=1 Tax=Bicyclus anynana TaxID=110368 RepID=A0A6J1N821_BICAN|nr:vegetative catalase-like [Bicyclus anynana]
MKGRFVLVFCFYLITVNHVTCSDPEVLEYLNRTQPALRQLAEFKLRHPKPIGILTTSAGKLVELREITTLNSDSFSNQYFIDSLSHSDAERIPERVVHAKGIGAHGYFEVTHDVSKYTKADVFNGIGKKTPVFGRFSVAAQNLGGNDLVREQKGLAVKFYTREGNLDFLCIHIPVFFYKDPLEFAPFIHSAKRNPRSTVFDPTMRWDFVTKRPDNLHGQLWINSDFGLPNGYRKMNQFPIHTYEINNKHGEKFYVRFNFISNQGIEFLSDETAREIGDIDYFNRDLYNAIENGDYPSWNLEMDLMTMDGLKKLDYDPFDLTRLWKKGTYKTIQIGRVIFNQNSDNQFRDQEQSAFNPGNLVPGIPGPMDNVFRGRRFSYRDAHTHRLGVNHNKIEINKPLYYKVYDRDGVPPVRENMKDAPNYYPNSFNGPVPYVDPSRPKERLVIYESNAVDLEPAAEFYNEFLQTEGQRERLVNTTVRSILPIPPELQRRVIRLYTLTDEDLGTRVAEGLKRALRMPPPPPPRVIRLNPRNSNDHHRQHYYST